MGLRGALRTSDKHKGGGVALQQPNKLTASEYDGTTWSARTYMASTTQRLSVAVQFSAAQEVARREACRWRPTTSGALDGRRGA